MKIVTLIDNTNLFIKYLLTDKNEEIAVTTVLDNCSKEVDVLLKNLTLNPQLYKQRERLLSEIAEKGYNELVSKVNDELWLKINLIGFVYQYYYENYR